MKREKHAKGDGKGDGGKPGKGAGKGAQPGKTPEQEQDEAKPEDGGRATPRNPRHFGRMDGVSDGVKRVSEAKTVR